MEYYLLGKSMRTLRNELTLFFLITFTWSWAVNLPRILESAGLIDLPSLLSTILGYAATFGPSVAAFLITGVHIGKAGVKTLWKKGWECQFSKAWLLLAVFFMPIAGGLTVLLLRLCGQPINWNASLPPAMIIPVGLPIWLLGALPEEYGWRGYALDR